MDLFLIISIILGILAGLLGLAFFILQSRVRNMTDYIHYIREERPFRSYPPEFIPVGKSSRELKKELLEKNELKLFYYFDENTVEKLHNQILESFKHKLIEEETIGKKGMELGFEEVIKASIGKGESKRKLERFTISENIEMAYNEVEKYLIRHNQITFGLESFDYDHSIEIDFFRQCERIKEEFDFEIPQTVKDDFVEKIKKKYTINEKLKELEEAKGFVIMREDFEISALDSNQPKLIFCTPYEKGEKKICIEVPLNKNNITKMRENLFLTSDKINLTIFGYKDSWESAGLRLKVSPFVIY